MKFYIGWFQRLAKDQRGQDMIEYALLGGFVAVVVAAFFPTQIGPNITMVFSKVAAQLTSAANQSSSTAADACASATTPPMSLRQALLVIGGDVI